MDGAPYRINWGPSPASRARAKAEAAAAKEADLCASCPYYKDQHCSDEALTVKVKALPCFAVLNP